jgi:hypothetical protein
MNDGSCTPNKSQALQDYGKTEEPPPYYANTASLEQFQEPQHTLELGNPAQVINEPAK